MESLNGQFGNEGQYFKLAVDFLTKYEWLYQYPNTDILLRDVLANVQKEWISILQLCQTEVIRKAIAGDCCVISVQDIVIYKFLINMRQILFIAHSIRLLGPRTCRILSRAVGPSR